MAGSLQRLYAARAVRVGLATRIGHRPIMHEPERGARQGRDGPGATRPRSRRLSPRAARGTRTRTSP
jgi:hypothetical protein